MWDKTHYNNDEFEIILYELSNGKSPVYEFIDNLDEKLRNKVIKNIDELKIRGNRCNEPLSKKIDNVIFELRILREGKYCRLFYFFSKDRKIVITNGYIKKSNKTPKKELELAIKYRKDWLIRNEKII